MTHRELAIETFKQRLDDFFMRKDIHPITMLPLCAVEAVKFAVKLKQADCEVRKNEQGI